MSEPKATRATVKRSLRPTYHLFGDGLSEPKATRAKVKRSLRPTYHLLGDGLRKLLRHKLLRVTLLAAVFLGARWNPVMRIPLIPTLLIMFSLRHFVLTPPPKKDKENT